jgi:hypothetical protein
LPGLQSYGTTRTSAVAKVQSLALRVLAEKMDNGEAVLAPAQKRAINQAAQLNSDPLGYWSRLGEDLKFLGTAAALISACACASGQAGSSRHDPPPPAAHVRPFPDSVMADVEDIEVINGGMIWDLMGPRARRMMRDTLDSQRLVWTQRRPTAYLIRTLEISDCMLIELNAARTGPRPREQLLVRDTTIVSRILAPLPVAYSQRCPLVRRVEDLFADVERALSDPTALVLRVQYDAAYGFPRSSWIAVGRRRGAGTLVESFAPVP